MGALEIVDLRDQLPWHPDRPHWPGLRSIESIDRVILHQSLGHADTSGNRDVFGINNYHITPGNHISAAGCPHICYHLVIDDDGTVYQANDFEDVVWHCKGQNTRSLGVLLVGDFAGPGHPGGEPTAAQERAFFALAEYLMATLHLPPTAFFGHKNFGKLACPGNTAYGWIKQINNSLTN